MNKSQRTVVAVVFFALAALAFWAGPVRLIQLQKGVHEAQKRGEAAKARVLQGGTSYEETLAASFANDNVAFAESQRDKFSQSSTFLGSTAGTLVLVGLGLVVLTGKRKEGPA